MKKIFLVSLCILFTACSQNTEVDESSDSEQEVTVTQTVTEATEDSDILASNTITLDFLQETYAESLV